MRQRYDEAVAAKSKTVDASIAGLIAQAEALSQAPESVERGELLELAGAWRGVEVTAGNLADAVQAEARLAELAGTVAAQQEQVAEAERARIAQEEAARNQPRQATPAPAVPLSQLFPRSGALLRSRGIGNLRFHLPGMARHVRHHTKPHIEATASERKHPQLVGRASLTFPSNRVEHKAYGARSAYECHHSTPGRRRWKRDSANVPVMGRRHP
ncbi:hypothetical protein [Bifidobacterium aesculapii]|uniref:hypothetical protein n=1 Tax=Bifidobacterium aesculapii TaxID=1329411 RepID=UPI0006E14DB3|nr:hypothetical protein [Bifidobacterium aesculapii]